MLLMTDGAVYKCVTVDTVWHILTIFIVRQHAMPAERKIVLPILSVCLSSAGTVSKQMDISSDLLTFW